MSFVIGLTGSIGMGKSTTAQIFRDEGIPVWDADAAVDDIYGPNGEAVAPLALLDPELIGSGAVSKTALKARIAEDPEFLTQLEHIVHPLVAKHRQEFLARVQAEVIVLDVPLLFETGLDASVDATICVSIDAPTQRRRVMARATMTETEFDLILSKQMSDAEKRSRADYVVITDTLSSAYRQVTKILQDIRANQHA
ncbi:dephospho-CoA kinase [Algirhabdus cladophorae]|uniref:dephospho-CoA kinase n=1 Tax=Algirhabdus cladophorae TaxID=3377108 RepID=UPI003B8455B9